MMTTTTLETPITRSIAEVPLYEVVNGRHLELPPMGGLPTDIATILTLDLGTFARRNGLGKVVVEMLFLIDRKAKLQRRPDVAFISAARWPVKKLAPEDAAWDVVPDLAIEVVSPTDRAEEALGKIREYFEAGARAAWVVYPKERVIYLYDSFTSVRILTHADVLEGGAIVPGFRLPLAELFEDEPEGPPDA